MKVIGFKPEHLLSLDIQAAQAGAVKWLTPEVANAIAEGTAWTWLEGDLILACGGIVPYSPMRAHLWSFISRHSGRHLLKMFRSAQALVAEQPFNRLEATTACDFKAGHKWLQMLGFTLETPRMIAYDINGKDHAMYVRIRRG